MKRRAHAKIEYPGYPNAESQLRTWIYIVITLFAAAILAVGFFYAAKQHFSAMELSFRNSSMRQQIAELESERRRLTLEREIARSPAEIKRTARRLGFAYNQPEIARATISRKESPMGRDLIQRTAINKPANVVHISDQSGSRPEAGEKLPAGKSQVLPERTQGQRPVYVSRVKTIGFVRVATAAK